MARKNSNIIINNSTGVIIGDSNAQNVSKKDSEFFEVPINEKYNTYIDIFRGICEKIGPEKFLKYNFAGFIVSIVPLLYLLNRLMASNGSLDFLGSNSLIYLFISILVPSAFGGIMGLFQTSKCKDCKKPFAYKEYRKKSTSERKRGDSTFYTLKSYLKCDYCGHKIERKRNVEVNKDTGNSGKIF